MILDRWCLSSLIYGSATGVNQNFNDFLQKYLTPPDVTIVLDGPALVNKCRDVYEKDSALQISVRKKYHDWAIENSERCILISNQGGRSVVHDRIVNALKQRKVIA